MCFVYSIFRNDISTRKTSEQEKDNKLEKEHWAKGHEEALDQRKQRQDKI